MGSGTIKNVTLGLNEWVLAHTVIFVSVATENVDIWHPAHISLAKKIEDAKFGAYRSESITQIFTDQERIYMRRYISTYCANLAENMKKLPDGFLRQFQELEIMSLYKMANKVQLAFSSI